MSIFYTYMRGLTLLYVGYRLFAYPVVLSLLSPHSRAEGPRPGSGVEPGSSGGSSHSPQPGPSGESSRPRPSSIPETGNTGLDKMTVIEETLQYMARTLALLSKDSVQPPSKRPRLDFDSSRPRSPVPNNRTGSTMFRSPSTLSLPSVGGEEREDSDEDSKWAPPSARRGWFQAPRHWNCEVVDGVAVTKLVNVPADGQPDKSFNIRFQKSGGEYFFWALPKPELQEAPESQKELVSGVPLALASLAPLASGGPSITMAGTGKRSDGCKVKSGSLSPALALSTLPTFWASKVAGDKKPNTAGACFITDPKPFKQTWPEGSDEEKVFSFLRDSDQIEMKIPGGLSSPSGLVMKEDKQARAKALGLLQATGNLDLLTSSLVAAKTSMEDSSWAVEDVGSFLGLTIKAMRGIGALFAPHARDAVREAISKRVSLREECIPKDLVSLKHQLLSLNPLNPHWWGGADEVAKIIASKPPPAEVHLKGLDQLQKWAKSTAHSKGQGQSRAQNPKQFGNKSQGGQNKGKGPNKPKGLGQASTSNNGNKKPFHGGQGKNSNNKGSSTAASNTQKDSQKRN